jgi:DNA-directed RNA polymerase specialized sigma24 family protein
VNERGDRAAMVCDVQIGYGSLDDDDKDLLALKYGDGGLTDERVAACLDLSQQTVNYRLHRALRRMGAALGGEPFEGRRAISNARAQFQTRHQEEV